MRRDHVASTLIRRHFNVVCLLGIEYMYTYMDKNVSDQTAERRRLSGHSLFVWRKGHFLTLRIKGFVLVYSRKGTVKESILYT